MMENIIKKDIYNCESITGCGEVEKSKWIVKYSNSSGFTLEMLGGTVIYNRYKAGDKLKAKYSNIAGIRKRDGAIKITKNCLKYTDRKEFIIYPNREGLAMTFIL